MESTLDAILDSLRDAIFGVDEHSNVVLLNEAAASLFGCDRLGTIGGPASRCPVLADALGQLPCEKMAAPGASSKPAGQLAIRRGGQEPVTMEVAVSSAIVDGRKVSIVILRDVSAELQMERTVYEARKTQALGALADMVVQRTH